HHLRRVRERVALLRGGAKQGDADAKPDGVQAPSFADALDQLEASTNALGAVEDELVAQNEELRRSLTFLEGERAKYLDLFENARDAYRGTDGLGIVSDANLAARRLLGTGEDGLVGKPLTSFVMSRDVPRLRFVVRTLVDCELPQEIDVRMRRKSMKSAI